MHIVQEDFPIEIYPGLLPDEMEQVVFFDIETTGFSGNSALLYLIGCVFYREKHWQIQQWFLNDYQEEKEMLLSFFDFISAYTWLIHFNGTTFDIPFIEKRLTRHHLSKSFSFFESLDLYKEIKPYKKLLSLEGLKQKNLEQFLGIHRTDPFTGGELIDVYYEYMETKHSDLLSCLLLHNADDLRGMLSILPLHGLILLLQGAFRMISAEESISADNRPVLIFTLESVMTIPDALALELPWCSLVTDTKNPQTGLHTISVSVPLTKETLKYFYDNYRDYYYLPEEDQAIHKSVGIYVDKSCRKAATRMTCYTKRESTYLPLPDSHVSVPIFRRKYKDKLSYMELTAEFMQKKELQKEYLLQLFRNSL